jgi:hypothetical protein
MQHRASFEKERQHDLRLYEADVKRALIYRDVEMIAEMLTREPMTRIYVEEKEMWKQALEDDPEYKALITDVFREISRNAKDEHELYAILSTWIYIDERNLDDIIYNHVDRFFGEKKCLLYRLLADREVQKKRLAFKTLLSLRPLDHPELVIALRVARIYGDQEAVRMILQYAQPSDIYCTWWEDNDDDYEGIDDMILQHPKFDWRWAEAPKVMNRVRQSFHDELRKNILATRRMLSPRDLRGLNKSTVENMVFRAQYEHLCNDLDTGEIPPFKLVELLKILGEDYEAFTYDDEGPRRLATKSQVCRRVRELLDRKMEPTLTQMEQDLEAYRQQEEENARQARQKRRKVLHEEIMRDWPK